MIEIHRIARVALALALAAAAPLSAQSKKTAAKTAPPDATKGAPPQITVSVESILDRRTTRDFPRSELQLAFKLDGQDAGAVQSARAHVTKATDDTGRSLIQSAADSVQGSDNWQESRDGGAPTPRMDLASPSRKAKTMSVEGVLETYLPSRDPACTVKIDRVISKRDKPLTVPALAAQRIGVQVISKAALEKEKAQAKKKEEAAKKKDKKSTGGLEEMGQAMGDALTAMLERIFLTAGENDLIVKVDDPGKKIFSLALVEPEGKAIQSYGTLDLGAYRVVRMLEPIPSTATLLVRLKTPKSFGEIPFNLADLKLP